MVSYRPATSAIMMCATPNAARRRISSRNFIEALDRVLARKMKLLCNETTIRTALWRCVRILLSAFAITVFAVLPAVAQSDLVQRGAYVVRAAGCVSCHTDKKGNGEEFAGGRALKTPFGIFYSPNITADKKTGIGNWSDEDFVRALKKGVRPDGARYFPVFPYTSYTLMSKQDALAIKAYLFSLTPVVKKNRDHDVSAPFSWRWPMRFWQLMYFTEGGFVADPKKDAEWNRGAYLATAMTHCAECHTPRNFAGGPVPRMDQMVMLCPTLHQLFLRALGGRLINWPSS